MRNILCRKLYDAVLKKTKFFSVFDEFVIAAPEIFALFM